MDFKSFFSKVRQELEKEGVKFEMDVDPETDSPSIKIEINRKDLKESVREMNENPRDQVVMVRLDAKTVKKLDSWVETGALKSRSEATALFIREGLLVRDKELQELQEALNEVDAAKERLRKRAREVFGGDDDEEADDSGTEASAEKDE